MFLFDRMDVKLVQSLLETIPMELTVIDANDEVIAWNKHDTRLFHRPTSSMGINFRECHPKESLDKVERIVAEMKAGTRQKASFWIHLQVPYDQTKKHLILIEFFALRDPSGKYIGCVECTQDVEEIRGLSGERRLLD